MNIKNSPGNQNRLIKTEKNNDNSYTLFFLFTAIILLHLIGTIVPGYHTWGFSFWSVIGKPTAFILLGITFFLLIPQVNRFLLKTYKSLPLPSERSSNKMYQAWEPVFIALLLFILFYLFRSRAHVYGDGYMVLSNLTNSEIDLTQFQDYQKSLAFLLHYILYLPLANVYRISPEHIFAMINAVGGVVGIWGLHRLISLLTSDKTTRWFIFLCSVTSGSVILFFGYIEYYTWATAFGLWTLCYAIKYVQTKTGLLPLIVLTLLTIGFHVLAIPFLLTAVLAILYRAGNRKRLPFGISFKSINLTAIILSFIVASAMQLYNQPQWFMLILPIDDVPYWFLSIDRINDIINLSILVSPVGTLFFLLWIFSKKKHTRVRSVEESLLGSAALFCFLVAFWIEPKLGAARDWDFSSWYGFPLTLWGTLWLVNTRFSGFIKPYLLIPAMVILLVHVVPNLIEKNDVKLASKHLDTILWDSPHHQIDYGKARRSFVWGITLYNNAKEPELAVPNIRRHLEADSTSAAAWFKLADYYYEKQIFDSSLYYFTQAVKYDLTNPLYLTRLADVEAKTGQMLEAIKLIHVSENIKPDDFNTQFLYGVILTQIEEHEDAILHFRKALALKPDNIMSLTNIGMLHAHLEEYDTAFVYLTNAIDLNPQNTILYKPLLKVCLALNKLEEAKILIDVYRQISPDPSDIENLIKQYQEAIKSQN